MSRASAVQRSLGFLQTGRRNEMVEVNQNVVAYILSRDDCFRYQLLDRMRQDCLYFLSYGSRNPKCLWANNAARQIAYMKAIWQSFPAGGKPEWLTMDEIISLEKTMVEGDAHAER